MNIIKRLKRNKRLLASAVLGGALIIAVGGAAAVSGLSGRKASPSNASAASEAETEEGARVLPMSPDGPQFPSLAVELPTEAPPPEYLRTGVSHSIVAKLQARLMELGFMDNDEPTEYYGPVTEAAVKTYQRQNNLAQDGIVGSETLASIMADDAKYYAAKNGDIGEDIIRIQTRLYELGYIAEQNLITGNFGDKTEEAVKKLQERNGLAQDGKVGQQTLNLIYSEEVKANMLAYGEKSDVVLSLQQRLFHLGYMTSTPDGSYGNDTSLAVKAFQSRNDLVVDGYLGPSTRMAIMSGNAVPNGLVLGDQSDQVTNVQKLLSKWGYLNAANVTGYYGEATESAVKAFQSRNGLTSDGSVGARTIAKLTSDDAKRPAPAARPNNNSSSGRTSVAQNNPAPPAQQPDQGGASANAAEYTGGGGVGTLLSVASSKIGCPYVWGAKGPNSFDCSGFVYWCLNNSGVRQSYLTSSGWRSVGKYARINNFSELQAGDIVVVSGHVGIAAGGGQVIDASSSNGRVVRRSLSGWWQNGFIVGWRIF